MSHPPDIPRPVPYVLAQQMGERGYRRVVEMFTWDKVVERMRPCIAGLIGDRPAG